jgi:hypothetical protein
MSGIALFSVSIAFNLFRLSKCRKVVKIKELWIYPVKSCKGIQVSSCKVAKTGFLNDRIFMVVDGTNKFVSQRSYPKMALISTAISCDGSMLTLSAHGMDNLNIPLSQCQGIPLEVKVWGDLCHSVEVPGAGKWFSSFLGVDDLHLVRMLDGFERRTDANYAPYGQTSFADGFPFLLSSQESLDDLNSRIKKPVTSLHFRPNIIVEGCNSYAEDTWKTIRLVS